MGSLPDRGRPRSETDKLGGMARKNPWKALGAVALGTLLGCFESSVTPSTAGETTGETTGGAPGNACIPGETQTCLCVGGGEGVQVCNAEGSGYGECACVGETNTSGGMSGASTGTTGVDSLDTGGTVASAGTVGTDPGMLDTGEVGTGFPPGSSYGPCPNMECPQDELCLVEGATINSVCASPCRDDAECPPPPRGYQGPPTCRNIPGTADTVCVLPCATDRECPPEMFCGSEVCLWP